MVTFLEWLETNPELDLPEWMYRAADALDRGHLILYGGRWSGKQTFYNLVNEWREEEQMGKMKRRIRN